MATITPLPAHPTPGSGPPDSTHSTSPYPRNRISSVVAFFLFFIISSIVGILSPTSVLVVSAFGSQPITSTFLSSECAAAMLETMVDFPIPPFP